MQAVAIEMAKKIAEELMAAQVKFLQDEMKKIQDEMSKMKEELSKKVDDAISGKNEANKDVASDVRVGEHAHEKGIYSNVNFDYGQLIKGSPLHTPSVNIDKPPHFDRTRYTDWSYKMKMHCRTQFCIAKSSTHICAPRISKHTYTIKL